MEKIIHFVWHPEEWIKAYKEMQYNKNFLLDFYKNKEEEFFKRKLEINYEQAVFIIETFDKFLEITMRDRDHFRWRENIDNLIVQLDTIHDEYVEIRKYKIK